MRIVIFDRSITTVFVVIILAGTLLAPTFDGREGDVGLGIGPAVAAGPIDYSSYDYYVNNLTVVLLMDVEGSMVVMEMVEFTFNRGSYDMAFREIPHTGFDKIANVEVKDETGKVIKIGYKYQFDMFKGKYIVRWTFPTRTGPSNATFLMTYNVVGALKSVT